MDNYPWCQLSLIPPPELTLEITVHAVGASDVYQVGIRTTEGPQGDLVGIETRGFPATVKGDQLLMRFLYQYIKDLQSRCSPF